MLCMHKYIVIYFISPQTKAWEKLLYLIYIYIFIIYIYGISIISTDLNYNKFCIGQVEK